MAGPTEEGSGPRVQDQGDVCWAPPRLPHWLCVSCPPARCNPLHPPGGIPSILGRGSTQALSADQSRGLRRECVCVCLCLCACAFVSLCVRVCAMAIKPWQRFKICRFITCSGGILSSRCHILARSCVIYIDCREIYHMWSSHSPVFGMCRE